MILVGLGNPGPEYATTRHNLGFVVLDALAQSLDVSWNHEREVVVARYGDSWLLKPQTFMNKSGSALQDFLTYKNISIDSADIHRDLLVVHDELDFEPGDYKIQRDRSSAGHNGVQSIIDQFNTKDFSRLRLGIGNGRLNDIPSEDYVLQRPPEAERELLATAVTQAVEELVRLVEKK